MNNETKQFEGHTPGPWKYDDGHLYSDNSDTEYNSIAHVYDTDVKHTKGNIELLAAAPELLKERDALKIDLNEADETSDLLSKRIDDLTIINAELLEALKQMVKEDEGIVSVKSQHSVFTIKKALEAIAKAEGRANITV